MLKRLVFATFVAMTVVMMGRFASAMVLSGSYTGNSAASQAITVGFQPDVVIVRRNDVQPTAGPPAVIRTATMTGTKEVYSASPTAASGGLIQSLDPNGFTVAQDPRTNQSGQTYYWIAFKTGPGRSAVGSYDGDNSSPRPIAGLGFTPALVIVIPQGPYNPYQHSSAMPVDESFHFGNSSGDTNRIRKPLADGFEVGNADETNRGGVKYHYVAWKAVAGQMSVGFYTGDGSDNRRISGVGFRPEYVVVKRDGSNAPAHKPLATGPATDWSLLFNAGYDDSNWIQALYADGFQVGNHSRVNTSGDRHYWMAWGNGDSGGMVTTPVGQKITVETPEVKMVWDTAKGGGLHELYGKTEANPSTSRTGDALYNLFGTNVNDGAWYIEGDTAGTLDLLEATRARVRLRQKRSYGSFVHLERDWTVVAMPRLSLREALVFDNPLSIRGVTGIHAKGETSCGGGNTFYCAGQSDATNRIWLTTDDSVTYADMLAVPYADPFFGRPGTTVSWENSLEPGAPNTWRARVRESPPSLSTGPGTDTRSYVFYPHLEGLTSTGNEWQPYASDYRNPGVLTIAAGSIWQDPVENTAAGDAFNEAESAYALDMNPVSGLDFSLDGTVSNPRRRPFFKIRQWRSVQAPATIVLQGQTLVRDRDYVADVKPIAYAVFCNDPACSTYTKLARGGLVGDADEYLADPARNFPLGFSGVGTQYLYLGAESTFRGIGIALQSLGLGATADLNWEYWDGAAWTSLEAVAGFTDLTNSLRKNGSLFWSADPAAWSPTIVAGSPSLYYVRASLGVGSYTSPPTEAEMRTDILLLQHGGDVTASGQRFVMASAGVTTNYRSLGNASNYGTAGPLGFGTKVTASTGSTRVVGTGGTTWRADNRGRGDVITIATVPYTVYAVISDAELELTSPYVGPSGPDKDYAIARQFATLAGWKTCISGGGGCGPFSVASSNLVSDNRNEVGIAYRDSAFAPGLVIDGSTTDAGHTITLTADHGNRHYGVKGAAGTRALIDNTGSGPAIRVQDEYVTVEWLEIKGGSGTAAHGVEVSGLTALNRVVLDSLLIHDTPGSGIEILSPDTVADVYNNVVYEANYGIRINTTPSGTSRIRLLNNTVFSCNQSPGPSGIVSVSGSNLGVLLRNNIAHSNNQGDFAVPARDPVSSHNLGSDGSGISHSSAGTGIDVPQAQANTIFVSVVASAEDLHILALGPADDRGVNLSSLFTGDVDAGLRPPSAVWDIGADELPAAATDLTVAKTDGQTVAVPGQPVTYTITVTNNGPTPVSSLKLIDAVPAGLQGAAWDPGVPPTYDPLLQTWTFGSPLGVGASATVTLSGTIDPSARGTLVNSATVLPPAGVADPVPQNDSAVDSDDLDPRADLALTKAANPADPLTVELGGVLTYTLTVTNFGPSTATEVILTDPLPPDMAYESANADQGGCTLAVATHTLTCNLGSIAPSPSPPVTVTLVVRPQAVGRFTNGASVAALEIDPGPNPNSDSVGTTVELPSPGIEAFTVTSTSEQNLLEWVNPTSAFDYTEIRVKTTGYPSSSTDGSPAYVGPGSGAEAGQKISFAHSLVGQNGTTLYYGAFVHRTAAPLVSSGRFCNGRPFATTGPVKWAFSTGATAVSPPTVSSVGVLAPSNDNLLYAMERGLTGGQWPAFWKPMPLGGPVQSRSPVVPLAVAGANPVIYLGAQDGGLYWVDGVKGKDGMAAFPWSPVSIGDMVQAAPSGIFMGFGSTLDYLLVGTRNAGDNFLRAVDPQTGALVGAYSNGGGANAIGIINTTAAVDYATKRVYFTSYAGGSANTLWCLNLADAVPGPVFSYGWARAQGDIDSSPILSGGRVYVGSAAGPGTGTIYSIDADDGETPATPDRTLFHGDGQVKGFVFPDRTSPSGDLYFATESFVWGVTDTGAPSMTLKFQVSLGAGVKPSAVLFVGGSSHLYVGGSDGNLYQIDVAAAPSVEYATLGDGKATVGAPSIDLQNDLVHVGTEAGVFYAVDVPLPAGSSCFAASQCTGATLLRSCYTTNPGTECATNTCQGAGVCSP